MAKAARSCVAMGAQLIDINMGCPAKKVCNKAAGSALLRDELLVANILRAVVSAVQVPVTLKIRTGWDNSTRNALSIAHIAESEGIQALAIHGRTRADRFNGEAEYDTIAAVKQSINIPVLANGDICSPHKARQVLEHTAADGLLIGRAARGRPWIFREIGHYLKTRKHLAWYLQWLPDSRTFRSQFNSLDSPQQQLQAIVELFRQLTAQGIRHAA